MSHTSTTNEGGPRLLDALEKMRPDEGTRVAGALVELVFIEIGRQRLAFFVSEVSEILRPSRITPIPRLPEYVLGVINRLGRVIAVLDLARYSGSSAEKSPSRLVVLTSGDLEAAIPVTSVEWISSIDEATIQPVLPSIADHLPYLVGQISQHDVLYSLVDGQRLLSSVAGMRQGR